MAGNNTVRYVPVQDVAMELGKNPLWGSRKAKHVPGAELRLHPTGSCRRWMVPDTEETRQALLDSVQRAGRPKVYREGKEGEPHAEDSAS